MSQQQKTAGVDFKQINIDGKSYTLRPLRAASYGEMEAYIVSRRPDPIEELSKAIESIPEKLHANAWKGATEAAMNRRHVSVEDAAAFENSIRGIAWKFSQCLRQDHPEYEDVEKAIELLAELGPERLQEIETQIEVASGRADLKK